MYGSNLKSLIFITAINVIADFVQMIIPKHLYINMQSIM